MTLQEELDKQGYTASLEELEAAKALRDKTREILVKTKEPAEVLTILKELLPFEEWIKKKEISLKADYEAVVKLVDAQNDLDFHMLDIEETAERVLEYMERDHPDSPATAQIREQVEKIRSALE